VPVKYSADPFSEGREPLRWMSIASPVVSATLPISVLAGVYSLRAFRLDDIMRMSL
jgi:hypothetical protein